MKLLGKVLRKGINSLNLNLFNFVPPYDYVQNVNEYNIHKYLGVSRESVESWCIVGGYLGNEVPTILRNFPNCTVTIFECSQRYASRLKKRFAKESRVEIVENAVSNKCGNLDFFETTLTGSGSILKLGELAKSSYGAAEAEVFEVRATTLDEYFGDKRLDVLQIDVQGAELSVVQGAEHILEKAKAVFTEVSVKPDLYQGSVTIAELSEALEKQNFELVMLGTGFNLTGNALYIKSE